jgi:hypothetical protein
VRVASCYIGQRKYTFARCFVMTVVFLSKKDFNLSIYMRVALRVDFNLSIYMRVALRVAIVQ